MDQAIDCEPTVAVNYVQRSKAQRNTVKSVAKCNRDRDLEKGRA